MGMQPGFLPEFTVRFASILPQAKPAFGAINRLKYGCTT